MNNIIKRKLYIEIKLIKSNHSYLNIIPLFRLTIRSPFKVSLDKKKATFRPKINVVWHFADQSNQKLPLSTITMHRVSIYTNQHLFIKPSRMT